VLFDTKCAVAVLIRAGPAAHLCSCNIQQCDASATSRTPLGELTALPQTSGLDIVEKKGRGGCNIQQCDATPRAPLGKLTALPQTSGLDIGERKGRAKRRGRGKGKGNG